MDRNPSKMYSAFDDNFLKCKANSIQEQERTNMENNLEAWCERLLEMNFEVGLNAVD